MPVPDRPRVGEDCVGGSAPHMRGILGESRKINPKPRISPAHAGNTLASVYQCSTSEDQPRTCGEYTGRPGAQSGGVGSAPHMRGIPQLPLLAARYTRISPAHAGNTAGMIRGLGRWLDQPRTCGEYPPIPGRFPRAFGSAPHMRGIRRGAVVLDGRLRISPAHAGNTPFRPPSHPGTGDQPRTCGEYEIAEALAARAEGSAPHMRGIRFT